MYRVMPRRFRNERAQTAMLMYIMNRFTSTTSNIKTIEDIPGPRPYPALGTLPDFLFYKGGLSKSRIYLLAERVKTYGKIFKEVLIDDTPRICLVDGNDVEIIFRNEGKYPTKFHVPALDYFWEKNDREPGVFFLHGPEWYRHRKALGRQMLLPQSLQKHLPGLNNIARDLIDWLKSLRVPASTVSDRSYEVENIDSFLFKWSFESVALVIFGRRFGSIGQNPDSKADEFVHATHIMLGNLIPAIFYPVKLFDYYQPKSYKDFASAFNKMYDLTEDFINMELQRFNQHVGPSGSEYSCLLEHLVLKEKFSLRDVRNSLIDLFFAGVDTTSNTMQWVLYELAKHPDKQAKLYNEIKAIFPSSHARHDVSSAQLNKQLPFLKAVVKETLRLHPVLNELSRVLPHDMVLPSGYHLPAGRSVQVLPYLTSRHPDAFQEPEVFRPERWLEQSNRESHCKFSFLPFGFGRRMCLGRRLAEYELYILLAHLVLNFHFTYPESENLYPIARGTLIPEHPVRVKFMDRN